MRTGSDSTTRLPTTSEDDDPLKFLADATCPYCYHKVKLTSVMFRCSGRQAPGRTPCVPTADARQLEYLQYGEPLPPSFPSTARVYAEGQRAECPDCGGAATTRVCPVCHSVMPSTFGHAKSPMFGMVGVKGSGKTVYLTVLVHELKSAVRRRFGATVRSIGESPMHKDVEQFRERMNDGGALPPSTAQAAAERRYPIVLEWQTEEDGFLGRSKISSTILSFYDTAGEDLNTQNTTSSLAYLAAADGLIVLLDPFQFPENTQRGLNLGIERDALDRPAIDVMSRITELLRAADSVKVGKKIKRPLAVVVSKIDAFFDEVSPDHAIRRAAPKLPAFDEDESTDLHNHVEALVDEWGGDDVLSLLRTNYANYRFFAASALGAQPDYKTARADSQGLRPHRVAEPLLWLMADDKIIAKQD
jgi:hypothetical protein